MAVAPLVWLACAVASGASAAAVPTPSAQQHVQPGDAPVTEVVHTYRGSVKGFLLNGTWVFRGIPFAKPPVGDLRFAPPVPYVPSPDALPSIQIILRLVVDDRLWGKWWPR